MCSMAHCSEQVMLNSILLLYKQVQAANQDITRYLIHQNKRMENTELEEPD